MSALRGDPAAWDSKPAVTTPQEEAELDERLERVAEEKRRALAHPGPSWHDWFYFDAMKWFVGLGCLIVDAWIAAFWLEVGVPLGMAPSLAAAVYGEFLLFRVLWYRPEEVVRGRRFQRTWFRPVAFGRWTPEADQIRAGLATPGGEAQRASDEFL